MHKWYDRTVEGMSRAEWILNNQQQNKHLQCVPKVKLRRSRKEYKSDLSSYEGLKELERM